MARSDIRALHEDLVKLVVSRVVRDKVYKILIVLSRVNTKSEDRDLRHKYRVL